VPKPYPEEFREDVVRASGIEPTATVDSIADVPDLLASTGEF